MAEIFMAEENLPGGGSRTVAVKRLFPKLSADREFVGMFVNEARLASSMGHENIVQVFDMINYGSYYYIVMEYLEGLDLEEVVNFLAPGRMALPVEEIAYVMHEVALGLDYAHRGGALPDAGPVVHRDISPGNILIDKHGRVKITDFGIARALQYASFTRPGVLKGKYEYMAPEYVKGKEFDGKADLFSLGVVLYEMLTGESPFQALVPRDTWDRIVKYHPPAPSRINEVVSKEMDAVVEKALAKDPKKRVQTGQDFAGLLKPFFEQAGKDRVATTLGERVGRVMARDQEPITTQYDIDSFLPPGEDVQDHTQEIHLDELLDLVEPVEVPHPVIGKDGREPVTTPVKKTIQDERPRNTKPWIAAAVLGGLALGTMLVWWLWPRTDVGYLSVVSDLRAEVFVDGDRMGLAPLQEMPIEAGAHTVTVRRPGRSQSKRYTRSIEKGAHTTIQVTWKTLSSQVKKKRRKRTRKKSKKKSSKKTVKGTRKTKKRAKRK